MPKNSALLHEIEAVLKIYYEADGWLDNNTYKARLKSMIGDDQYQSSYTKKAQITSYFGFTVWQDIKNPQSFRKITNSGREMYEAINLNNKDKIQEVLMNALETITFGRNNYGSPDSDSDIEPPALFIRASMDLDYLTYKEFAYLLWKLEDIGANYTDSITEIRQLRLNGKIELKEEAQKYADAKPIMILVRWGFLSEDENYTGIKHIIVNPDVLLKYNLRLKNLKIYNIDMNCGFRDKIVDDKKLEERIKGGSNIILYGVPGSGKSWTIKHEYCDDASRIERLVFHPDYTYSDFVGQILPKIGDDGNVKYEFSAGPFTKLLHKAYINPNKMYYLIIEEVNRGNAPAIFGDIFQLLDRDKDGNSEYEITNADIAKNVYLSERHKVYIPSNMSILCTMNTSDQNVFTLDTAFQRRWNMRLIKNKFSNDKNEKKFAETKILDTDVTWEHFLTEINKIILSKNIYMTSSEDKRLGTHFIREEDLDFGNGDEKQISRFPEKVLKYLWDDAFKFTKEDIFDLRKINNLEDIIEWFVWKTGNSRFLFFKDNIYNNIVQKNEI